VTYTQIATANRNYWWYGGLGVRERMAAA